MAFDNLYLSGGDLFALQDTSADSFAYPDTSFTSINDDAPTVSPKDLVMSAPSSLAFPNLTPASSYLESPALGSSSHNTSPLIDGSFDNSMEYGQYYSLFPPEETDAYVPTYPAMVESPNVSIKNQSASPMVRQKSSPGRPPIIGSGHSRKHSVTSGVKPSKPRKPLPDILIDENEDKEVTKRQKNTLAARKSRQRRQENQEALESEVSRLRAIIVNMGGNPDDEQFE